MKLLNRTHAAADGALLATDIYLPATTRPVGCLLQRTPYGRRSGLALTTLSIHRAVEAGFAVAIQDVRGRGDSEGDFDPFTAEGTDGATAIAELSSWLGTPVVTYGASYPGFIQFLAAPLTPDGLVGMVPLISSSTLHDEWIWRGGALNLGFIATWVIQSLALDAPPGRRELTPQDRDALRLLLDGYPETLQGDPRELASRAADAGAPALLNWITEGARSPRWLAWQTAALMAQTRVAVFTIGGWFDLFQSGSPRQFRHLVESGSDLAHELVVGPWSHSVPFGPSAGSTWFGHGSSSGAIGLESQILEWAAARVHGASNTPRQSVFDLGTRSWVREASGGHVATALLPFHRRAGSPSAVDSRFTGRSVLVGGRGSATANVHLESGMHVQPLTSPAAVDYECRAIPSGAVMQGPLAVELELSSAEEEFHLAAALLHERDGVLRNVVDGYVLSRATPNVPSHVRVDLGETRLTVLDGDGLVLRLTASNWPTLERPASATNVLSLPDDLVLEAALRPGEPMV